MDETDGKFVTAAGLRTHYVEAGASERVIVLVHGGGAGADARGNWLPMMERLAASWRVIAVDMVGFGRTEKPRSESFQYSQQEREKHLTAFIETISTEPVVLVGNSMGGLTSLGVARERPDLVRALVLMGSAGIAIPSSPELRTIMEYDYTVAGMRRMIAALTSPVFRASEPAIQYRYMLSVEPETRYAYERITGWIRNNGGLVQPDERISSVETPTLVVGGKDDRVVPISCAYRFLDLIRNSWGYIMPRCGHWPMIEHPAEFARVVDNFARQQ